jgi:hypothetical protein
MKFFKIYRRVRMSVVPLFSKNSLAYLFGKSCGERGASVLLNTMTQHLDSCTSTREKIQHLVPFIGIGVATLAAYSIYPRSQALTPANLLFQGIVTGVHEYATRFFLNVSLGRNYTIQAQIRKYLGPSPWLNAKQAADSDLKLIQKWNFCEHLTPEMRQNLKSYLLTNPSSPETPKITTANFTTQDSKELTRIQNTLDEFKTKEDKEKESIASVLEAHYAKEPNERKEDLEWLNQTIREPNYFCIAFDNAAYMFKNRWQALMVGPSVPIELTDKCCTFFPRLPSIFSRLPSIKEFVPRLGFTCNKNGILFSTACDSIQTIADSILEHITPSEARGLEESQQRGTPA